MHTSPNAVELLRLRDELDALEQRVPEKWGFRVAVVVASLFMVLFLFDAVEALPFAFLAALFGWLVVYERSVRRARLQAQREVIERRIHLIEESERQRET